MLLELCSIYAKILRTKVILHKNSKVKLQLFINFIEISIETIPTNIFNEYY